MTDFWFQFLDLLYEDLRKDFYFSFTGGEGTVGKLYKAGRLSNQTV